MNAFFAWLSSLWKKPTPTPIPDPPVLLTNFAPHGHAAGEVFGNRRSSSGAYNAFAVQVNDPTKVRSLTEGNPLYGTQDTHRAVSDVSPDGRFMLVHAVNTARLPPWSGPHPPEAEPGKGAYNEVWLATTDGTRAWPLTNNIIDKAFGTFWARFDHTGDRIVFAQIMRPAFWPEYFGGQQLVVATITWTNNTPTLTDRIRLGNGVQFYEPYGFAPDGAAVVASSNVLKPGNPRDNAQILTIPLDGGPPTPIASVLGAGYQEFAFLRPDHTGYVITSGFNGWVMGADRWLVNAANPAVNPIRVTRFADRDTGHPTDGISGGMAFITNSRAVVGFTRGGREDAYLVPIPT